MVKSNKVFSLELFLQTLAQEKADGIIQQQDIDFALTSWANAIAGKTAAEIDALNGEGSSSALKPEWFAEPEEDTEA